MQEKKNQEGKLSRKNGQNSQSLDGFKHDEYRDQYEKNAVCESR